MLDVFGHSHQENWFLDVHTLVTSLQWLMVLPRFQLPCVNHSCRLTSEDRKAFLTREFLLIPPREVFDLHGEAFHGLVLQPPGEMTLNLDSISMI